MGSHAAAERRQGPSQSPSSVWHGRCNPKPRMRSCTTSPTRTALGLRPGAEAWRAGNIPVVQASRIIIGPMATLTASVVAPDPSRRPSQLHHHHQYRAPRDPAAKDPLAPCRPPDRSLGLIARAPLARAPGPGPPHHGARFRSTSAAKAWARGQAVRPAEPHARSSLLEHRPSLVPPRRD